MHFVNLYQQANCKNESAITFLRKLFPALDKKLIDVITIKRIQFEKLHASYLTH